MESLHVCREPLPKVCWHPASSQHGAIVAASELHYVYMCMQHTLSSPKKDTEKFKGRAASSLPDTLSQLTQGQRLHWQSPGQSPSAASWWWSCHLRLLSLGGWRHGVRRLLSAAAPALPASPGTLAAAALLMRALPQLRRSAHLQPANTRSACKLTEVLCWLGDGRVDSCRRS